MGPSDAVRSLARWAPPAFGGLLGLSLAASLLACGERFEEKVLKRPPATAEEVAAWTAQGDARRKPVEAFPDPPGDGPLVTAKYWVSLPAYEMEIRRRGNRVTLGIHGVDRQTQGGAWTAFAEGTIDGSPESFAGATARIVWSCIGLRMRGSADGVAKVVFSADGNELSTAYLQGSESLLHLLPDTYVKAYGRVAKGERPAYGELRGQIPYTQGLATLDPGARVVIQGTVRTSDGVVVPDALVQIRAVDRTRTYSDAEGRFRLELRGSEAPRHQSVCAGAIGYRNGETVLFTGDRTDDVTIEVVPLDLTDHPGYAWVHPAPDKDPDSVMACGTCHSWQYTEWIGSRHARMADNGHVIYERERMKRYAPEAPDDCTGCHQPAFAATNATAPYASRGVLASNHCDFCHKVTHTKDVTAPGVFGSLVLSRPDPNVLDRPGTIHRVFGPAPDVAYAYMGASFNPALSTSFLCAGCHQGGGLAGRPKVDTFEEWRTWAASRQDESFRSCQDCHMPGGTTQTEQSWKMDLFAWESIHRTPSSVHTHAFPGSGASFARDALGIEVAKSWDETTSTWKVEVTLLNRGAGHKIPTGTWTKHVDVGVWARQGTTWLAAALGPRAELVRDAPGADVALVGGDWRNPPGLVLGVSEKRAPGVPAAFYEAHAEGDLVDTRLVPGEPRKLSVAFRPSTGSRGDEPVVEVRVVHRRGAIGAGVETTPWEPRPYDAPPEVEWVKVVR